MIAARQIAFGKAAGAKKPYDAEIEYLESTGTQYIITDYIPNDNSVAELDFQSVGGSPSLMGVYSSSSRFNLGISTSNKNWFGGIGAKNTDATTALADSARRKLILDAPQKTLSVSGVGSYPCGSGSVGGNTARFNLFARNYLNSDGRNFYPARLYGVKFSEGGVVVIDLIPVRVGDVGFMYDRVSGQLFGNQGTGEFVLGPDL
jgi:hypothetical protein